MEWWKNGILGIKKENILIFIFKLPNASERFSSFFTHYSNIPVFHSPAAFVCGKAS
jgi:hypothetical protein